MRSYRFYLVHRPLESIVTRHGLSCMKYADDSQLYIGLNVSTQESAIEKIENCIKDVKGGGPHFNMSIFHF